MSNIDKLEFRAGTVKRVKKKDEQESEAMSSCWTILQKPTVA
jgi:hypothetical protein